MVPLFTSIGGGDTLSPLEAGKDFPSKKGGLISLLWGVGVGRSPVRGIP